jgi:putative transposase
MTYAIKWMCSVLQVSASGFYAWRERPVSARTQRQRRIEQSVADAYEQSNQIYGSWKIAEAFKQQETPENACRNTIATTMKRLGLKSCVCKKHKPQTTEQDPRKKPADNLLNQDFHADQPDQKWVTDITYLWTQDQGWVYLAAVMDLYSRKIVGWSMSENPNTDLVLKALHESVKLRGKSEGLIHHSDRGCQYTCDKMRQMLKQLNITPSMSRTGNCYDNAAMERFFWSLKHEWTHRQTYQNLDEARASVFKYIHTFYNTTRLHQTLGYLSPNQFEQRYHAAS